MSIYKENLFQAKTALITGGGTGIGLAIAKSLGELGARINIAARTTEVLHAAKEQLQSLNIDCECYELNIRDEQSVAALFERLSEEQRLPDILVNNAGGQFEAEALDISANGFRSVVDLNLAGTWHMSTAFAKCCMANNMAAVITNIVLCCGNGLPGFAHSAAARAGVINLTKTLANEWAKFQIRVNAVAPGTIQTSGLDQYDQESLQQDIQRLLIKRMGSPDEVAQAVTYLCSEAASFITGTVLEIDGGEHLLGASVY